MKESLIKAVHDDDMINLLKSLEVYDSVINEQYKCIFCNELITINNIDAILPQNEKVVFSCNQEQCHLKLLKSLGEGK